jgi:hypothetical protein
MVNRQFAFAGLDDELDGIRKIAGDKGAQGRFAGKAKPLHGVGHIGARPSAPRHCPHIAKFLEGREMFELLDLAIAHHHIGLFG